MQYKIFYSKIFFAEIGCITTVMWFYSSFCNCSFLCKKIVSYITVVQHIIILNVLANSKNKLHQILYYLSLLEDFYTNSFMAVLIHNLSVHSHSFTFYCKRKEKQISRSKTYKCRIALADFSMFLLKASTQVWQTTQSFASS